MITIADIQNEGSQRCRNGEMVADVAASLAHRNIEPEDALHLLVFGIARVIHDALAGERVQLGGSADSAVETEHRSDGPLPALNLHAAKMFRMYAASDGNRKMLLDFTLPDWSSFHTQAAHETAAWGKLAKASKIAIEALERTGKTTTSQLPKNVQKAIAEALP